MHWRAGMAFVRDFQMLKEVTWVESAGLGRIQSS